MIMSVRSKDHSEVNYIIYIYFSYRCIHICIYTLHSTNSENLIFWTIPNIGSASLNSLSVNSNMLESPTGDSVKKPSVHNIFVLNISHLAEYGLPRLSTCVELFGSALTEPEGSWLFFDVLEFVRK